MKLIMIAAVGIALASVAHANTEIVVQDGSTTRITYEDLDLKSAAGRATLANRIRSAAARLCLEDNVSPLAETLERVQCYRSAVTSGFTQMAARAK
jgi:UrcA family protein